MPGKTDRPNQDAASDGLLLSPMPEINKLKEALKSSCADLRKALQDFSPRKAAEVQNAMLENPPDPVDENNSSSRTDEAKDADDRRPDAAVCAAMQRSAHPGAATNGQNRIDAAEIERNGATATGRTATEGHDGGASRPYKPCPSLLDRNLTEVMISVAPITSIG